MPGRTSKRSTRTSTATVARKSSTATLKSTRGSASARTSAYAVEVPDEGEETSLRTQICQIFSDCQKTTATQRKLQINLRKIQERCLDPQAHKKKGRQEQEFDEEEFNDEVGRCVLRVLGVKKGEAAGERVIRFLGQFLKHASEKDQAMLQGENEESVSELQETPSSRLTAHILITVLAFLTAKDKTVRFRATQTVARIVNDVDAIGEDMLNLIRLALVKRLRDKEPSVRVQAVLGLGPLAKSDDEENEDEDNDDDSAVGNWGKLMDVMINDSSAEVRRTVLHNLPINAWTRPYMLERARDTDPSIRRMVYGRTLPSLGDFRSLPRTERDKVIRWGLRDRDDIVRKAAARLFYECWLEHCAASHDTGAEDTLKPGERAPPNMDALCELLERIDVVRSGADGGIAHEAMREFWQNRRDYRDVVTFDHEFWNELHAPEAFVARTLNDYGNSVEDDRLREELEDRMPEVRIFAYIIQKRLNRLVDLVDKLAIMEEDDPEAREIEEDLEEQDFVAQQLLHMALTLDYGDEEGRRHMFNITREALARVQLPEECTKLCVEVLRMCCGSRGESDFCAVILEAINYVKDTLIDDDATERGEDVDESFHSARSDVSERSSLEAKPRKTQTPEAPLSPEEEEQKRIREVTVYSKCLYIAQCTLQNLQGDLESNNSLVLILNSLIGPAVREQVNKDIRERGVICLGLCALLSENLATSNLELLFYCFTNPKAHGELKEIVIQVLTDLVIVHPALLAPPPPDPEATAEDAAPQPNPLLKPLTKVLLKAFHSDNRQLSLMACTAASKLLLLGRLPPTEPATANILKAFVLKYFNPETKAHPDVQQALSYVLPMFCHSKLKNAFLMAQISIPIMPKLLLMREDLDEESDEMVSWPVITSHLAEWTNGRMVVGTTELGLDGKMTSTAEAELPHIFLATAILERALGNTCSKDERKPLLTLLSKLTLTSSTPTKEGEQSAAEADSEALRTLHDLVIEAIEANLGMDATQRNYLSKLDLALTKRLGDVEHVTQVADETQGGEENENENEETVTQEVTEVAETRDRDAEEDDGDEEEDTMLAGLQGESTRMPLEEEEDTMMAGISGESTRMPLEEEEEEEESTVVGAGARAAITESDIVDNLLESEM